MKEFVTEPICLRIKKHAKPPRREGDVCLQKSLKFQQWLVVENHCIKIAGSSTSMTETEANCVNWKALVVLSSRETFFLSSCDNLAVNNQGRGGVVVEGRDTKDFHNDGQTTDNALCKFVKFYSL